METLLKVKSYWLNNYSLVTIKKGKRYVVSPFLLA